MSTFTIQPYTLKLDTSGSATLSEESGSTSDNRIVVVRTLTDDGAGHFIDNLGTVNYGGKQLSVKAVSFNKTTTAYKSDHEGAVEFEAVASDGKGSSGAAGARKGGEYGTANVGEEMLAGASVSVRYRVGAGAPVAKHQTFTPPAVVLDLCPYTSHAIVPGSVQFRWMGSIYSDIEGVIYRGRTDTSAGVASGTIDYAAGTAVMTGYGVGGTGPSDFQLLSLWTRNSPWTTASIFFSTEAAPLRAGPGGFVLTVVDTQGDTLTANVDAQGNITGSHMRGRLEFSRGACELQFGDFVLDASLTAAQKAQWWYSAADVGAVQPDKIWRPWPVDPTTLRYSTVSYIYLPVDVSLMGLDPAALPADGRAAFARPGDLCVIGATHGGLAFAPAVGMTYAVGHQRLSFVQVLDAATGAELRTGFTHDLDAGTVTFTELAGYPAQVKVVARTEVSRQIAEVRIDGSVRLAQPIGHAFEVGDVFSTALRMGDRFARVSRVYDQFSWDGKIWYDGVDPAKDVATATYNTTGSAIEVTNRGAITERWVIRIRADGSSFDLIGQHLGQIASGSIFTDFAPMNVQAGAPYMRVKAEGWGSGWVGGNTLFIDTIGAEAPIEVVRCTQPSTPAGINDSAWIAQRGDVGRAPESEL